MEDKNELLKKLVAENFVLSGDCVIGEFCEKCCPKKKQYGEKFRWEKHCGHYIGENPCEEANIFKQEYYKIK